MDKRVVMLAFLQPPHDDPFVNRLTAMASEHPYSHVKLIFNPYDSKALGFSIQYGESVSLRSTRLTNPAYTTLSVALPASNHEEVLRFCEKASNGNIQFDNLGAYLSYIHPHIPCWNIPSGTVGATFCSKIICEALQAGGVPEVSQLCPSACTPSRLFSAFRNSQSRVVGPMRLPQLLCIHPEL